MIESEAEESQLSDQCLRWLAGWKYHDVRSASAANSDDGRIKNAGP
ncbi:MAG: hypothetical protein KDA96_12570 [Planctomycetaceae bacterium]|nr:hypothetical protein [Planctomycetaceae bacterium]